MELRRAALVLIRICVKLQPKLGQSDTFDATLILWWDGFFFFNIEDVLQEGYRTGWNHGADAFTRQPNRTVVLDRLFVQHQSSLLCIGTCSKFSPKFQPNGVGVNTLWIFWQSERWSRFLSDTTILIQQKQWLGEQAKPLTTWKSKVFNMFQLRICCG